MPFGSLLLAIAVTGGFGAVYAAADGPTEPVASTDFQLETTRPQRGEYHLTASETLRVRAEELLQVLSRSRCRKGCEGFADHVERDEVLERRDTPRGSWQVRWTFVDSLLDASHFSVTEIVREKGRITRRFGTAPEDVIAKWSDEQRPHDPLFHWQGGTWTLTEKFDVTGRFIHTQVEVEMEMHSERFLINLAPRRVLAGAGDHLRTIFGDLRRCQEDPPSPTL
ncbi:MAG: hypothetical protein MPN21_22095 [Thermoanaerobaculia bacterium]|nr:hypothetical protein [Thermoanaerobaculia bacterium]